MRKHPGAAPRLAVLERVALGPRQCLALVEAEGRRFLVATSAEGAPAFCALDASAENGGTKARRDTGRDTGRGDWRPKGRRLIAPPARGRW